MTALQHTPGPWRYKKCPCGDPICTRYRIAHAGSEGMFSLDDATLIATAPDLLASLQAAVEAYDRHDDMGAWVAEARVAILQATQP